MNIFTEHTQQQGVTYVEHLFFAMGIAIPLACHRYGSRLICSLNLGSTIHDTGLFPSIHIAANGR